MKKILLTILFLTVSTIGFSQTQNEYTNSGFIFGIKPGFGINSGYFGIKQNNLSFYGGLEYFNSGGTTSIKRTEYDYDEEEVITTTDDYSFSFGIYNLFIGVNYYFNQKGSLKPYINLILSKPFITGSVEYDGNEDDDVEDLIDGISIWGGQIGYGVEYFFNNQFSLGAEFGMRYYYLSYEYKNEEDDEYNEIFHTLFVPF